jgi:hypothetical protein
MSNTFNWIIEPYTEFIIRPSFELEQFSYYFDYVREMSDRKLKRSSINTVQHILRNYITSLIAKLLGKDVVCSIDTYNDNLYGTVVKITIDLSAKDALELWLKLIDHIQYRDYGVILTLRWLGENDVDRDELVNYMVKIMAKLKTNPKALPGFNSIHISKEERE